MAARRPAQSASRSDNPTENGVQRTRAWTGMWVVVCGDVAIAAGAGVALWRVSGSADIIAILTSAFTAISTMTTAYFGIKTMSNTAQSFAAAHTAIAGAQAKGKQGAGTTGDDGTDSDGSPTSGPPIPADPANPTAAEIVARMAEPGDD